ncbi:hypothetical protein AGMMS49992_07500 [Clostridia bacterium]|nr:hypothetical protein AGMMS49992_07500 [Clostridia bacterium]
MGLPDRLRELRSARGWNQREAAAELGIELSKYNKWENGVYSPDYDALIHVARFYGTTTDYLLGCTTAMKEENRAAVETLGLSDSAVDVLRNMSETDIDLVSKAIDSNHLVPFLLAAQNKRWATLFLYELERMDNSRKHEYDVLSIALPIINRKSDDEIYALLDKCNLIKSPIDISWINHYMKIGEALLDFQNNQEPIHVDITAEDTTYAP